MSEQQYDHGFSHEEIAYGAFCIYDEEKRKGKCSGQDSNWFAAIDRLAKIRARANTASAGPKVCYMCDRPKTSVEHVPPRCFFPEQKDLPRGVDYRKSLITVPSCDVHNSDKSKDDVYLLAVIAAYYENNQPSKDHYGAKILRALQKSTGFAHCVLAGSERVSFGGDITTALRVDTKRFLRGLTNIAYGLYFHNYGSRCPHPVQVHTPTLHGDDKKPRQDVLALIDSVRPLLACVLLQGENPDIFQYQIFQVPGNPVTLIRMLFYQGAEVLAISAPELEEIVV
jgi:hypothetical protein